MCGAALFLSLMVFQKPSLSCGISMIFLPILSPALGSKFTGPRCSSAHGLPETVVFLRNFNDFPAHLLVQHLRDRAVPQPHGLPGTIVYLRNFNHFPPLTELYPRFKICGAALFLSPMDFQKPSFSCGLSMIHLPILRST